MGSDPRIEKLLNQLVYTLFARCAEPRDPAASSERLGGLVLCEHPADVDRVVKDPGTFKKNFSFISALGYSRFNTNGVEWATRRDITQDRYLAAAKPSRREAVSDAYEQRLAACGATLPEIQKALFEASLGIFYGAFGLAADVEPTVKLLDRVRDILRRLQYHSWITPTPQERDHAATEAKETIAAFGRLLTADRASAAEMQRFADAAGGVARFSATEEFVMNLFAGVETTVATATWVADRLAANGEVQNRILAEIEAGGADTPLTDCFINETMRYFPPIPFLIREVAADTQLGERSLRAGQLVLLSIVGVHHHPDFWHEPETFDSRRKEFLEDSFDRRAFIPFLAGPRMCGGARLGKLEVKEAVRALVRRFSFRRADNVVRFDYGLALRPASGASVSVSRR